MIRFKPILIVFALLVSLFATARAQAVYNAQTGRYLQADPNAMGIPVLTNLSWHSGESPAARVQRFSVRLHFADGGSRYEYVRSSPLTRFDPMGLNSNAELGVGGGLTAVIGKLMLAGVSGATSVMTGLSTTTGIWMINTGASGIGLFVTYNWDFFMMMASNPGWGDFMNNANNASNGMNPDDWDDLFKFYDCAEDAIGYQAHTEGIKVVSETSTKNPEVIAKGFTDTFIYETLESLTRYTVHYNPTTGQFMPAHLSGLR